MIMRTFFAFFLLSLVVSAPSCLFGLIHMGAGNEMQIGDVNFNWSIYADHRVAENSYQEIVFTSQYFSNADSLGIAWSSDLFDLYLSFIPQSQYGAQGYLAKVVADFKAEIYLHELYLTMDDPMSPVETIYKGALAIQNKDQSLNQTIIPYRDMAVEYNQLGKQFWVVASNYEGCENVEALSANRITLYDFKHHFFRIFNPVTNQTDLLRDTLYREAGSSFVWGFLIFTDQPLIPDINRWPLGKKAALCISNDADGETLPRLQAVFEGSSNPDSPKYYTKGIFARDIKVSNTIFGVYQGSLGEMWHKIKDHGNRIGYHTFTPEMDPPGVNAQALLHDLLPYDIRMWIDHALLQNPEDIGREGLNPDSPSYVADVINASGIDYIWPADTPPSNPFNAYDEPWRLPHRVWEAKPFTRPIWFYGRTRMEVWDYLNGWSMLGMKYQMTPANLDKLIAERGLHHAYTHFSPHPNPVVGAFYDILENGDHEIRDDVDEMLQMLKNYEQYRGLWIAPAEDIYDRMLAIEQVKTIGIKPLKNNSQKLITLRNDSGMDIPNFCFDYLGRTYSSPLFRTGTEINFTLSEPNYEDNTLFLPNLLITVSNGILHIKNINNEPLPQLNISIYNLRGQLLQKHEVSSGFHSSTSFKGRSSGIYLASIKDTRGMIKRIKFTVLK